MANKESFEMAAAAEQRASSVSRRVGVFAVVAAGFVTAPAVFLSFRFLEVVAQFEALFNGFGADLPAVTQVILSHRLLIAIVFKICTVCQVVFLVLLMVNRTPRTRRVFWMFAFIDFASTVSLVIAFYLPIFQLGSVV